ncbi:hypothetical protein LCGC14_2787190, partial [marine sediment metagenome]
MRDAMIAASDKISKHSTYTGDSRSLSKTSKTDGFVVQRFVKGDPVIHSTKLTGEEDMVFESYIDQHDVECRTEQPRSVVYDTNPDNRHTIT